jgi:Protein of unknown function (DUF3237)
MSQMGHTPMHLCFGSKAEFRRRVRGERLSGQVLDGGNDWQTEHKDGATTLNVRLVLKTNDSALIAMTYQGVRHGDLRLPSHISSVANGLRKYELRAEAALLRPGLRRPCEDYCRSKRLDPRRRQPQATASSRLG